LFKSTVDVSTTTHGYNTSSVPLSTVDVTSTICYWCTHRFAVYYFIGAPFYSRGTHTHGY